MFVFFILVVRVIVVVIIDRFSIHRRANWDRV